LDEFMKKAAALPQYSGMKPFSQPTGVVDVQLDKTTNRLATPACPDDYVAAFVAGTEPRETCDQQGGRNWIFLSRFWAGRHESSSSPNEPGCQSTGGRFLQRRFFQEKEGYFGKIAGIFRDDKSSAPASKPPADSDDTSPH